MPEIEIDGQKITVPEATSVLEAAYVLGKYIPHFCYHKKLSIAANCRMCLVDVDKAPKPLPACATPVVDGMKVQTHSAKAIEAQNGVMEFLLINHPLDCPICDQGGECQLQDLAVGYGKSTSRYIEKKRVVDPKRLGSLISAEEMSRCIHCSRCVRFLDEIAGFQEIGIIYRSEFAEVASFFDCAIESEISGNIIDLCPVGALTAKPFRYSARTWELSRRKSIAPHDGLGSNLIVQVSQNQVKRVLPFENEAINECWLSDRDRFSYQALNSGERLQKPMIKQDNQWHETDWSTALSYVIKSFTQVAADHGKETIGVLAHQMSTCEELYLLQKLFRGLGIYNIDSRLRRSDFRSDLFQQGAFWLGANLDDLYKAKAILAIGTTLRIEQPLLASRLRQLVKKGCSISVIHAVQENWLCELFEQIIVAPTKLSNQLAEILKALVDITGKKTPWDLAAILPSQQAKNIAQNLYKNQHTYLLLGQTAQHHPDFSHLLSLTQEIARVGDFSYGLISEAGNSVGAELVGALPTYGPFFNPTSPGLNVAQMFAVPQKAYFLFNGEPEADCYNGSAAFDALKEAKTVAACTVFKGDFLLDYADVLLPITPFTETAGCFVNMEGRLQSFNGVVRPLGEARPGWKVLRTLGSLWSLVDFNDQSIEDVRNEWLSQGQIDSKTLNNALKKPIIEQVSAQSPDELERIGEIPIYHGDAITRRAAALQKTSHAASPIATIHPLTAKALGVEKQFTIVVSQCGEKIPIALKIDQTVPLQSIRLFGAHPLTCRLGGLFDTIKIEVN